MAGNRDSGIELYRIIVMLAIIAHHYVANSGLVPVIFSSALSVKDLLLLMFSGWGKIGINCFVLITAYFMCEQKITLRKFLKLYFQIFFYNLLFGCLFCLMNREAFSFALFVKVIIPVRAISDNFIGCFLVFYLTIPFLNILLKGLSKRMHQYLLILTVGFFSFLPSFPGFSAKINYVDWFVIVFFVGAYLRKYPISPLEDNRWCGWASLSCLAFGCFSVLIMAYVPARYLGGQLRPSYWLYDVNKLSALLFSIFFFMYFKNLNLAKSNCINRVASTTFGVLLFHANSDAMRKWLWVDVCKCTAWYGTQYWLLHACVCVIGVFAVGSAIDFIRQYLFERPLFAVLDYIRGRKNDKTRNL